MLIFNAEYTVQQWCSAKKADAPLFKFFKFDASPLGLFLIDY